jgi:hypothetical protein
MMTPVTTTEILSAIYADPGQAIGTFGLRGGARPVTDHAFRAVSHNRQNGRLCGQLTF